jgi:hypothetical protein
MSQTLHSLKVRQRPDSTARVSTGANTEIFLDGKPLKGVTFLKFEFKAKKVTKVQLEMFTHIEDIEGIFVIGDLSPVEIVNKSEPVDKTQEIVDALLKGGLVYSGRATGKTKALARILDIEPNSSVFCDTMSQIDKLIEHNQNLEGRVHLNTAENRTKYSNPFKKIYLDEYRPGVEYPPFYAAVTSKVQVV